MSVALLYCSAKIKWIWNSWNPTTKLQIMAALKSEFSDGLPTCGKSILKSQLHVNFINWYINRSNYNLVWFMYMHSVYIYHKSRMGLDQYRVSERHFAIVSHIPHCTFAFYNTVVMTSLDEYWLFGAWVQCLQNTNLR